MSWKPREYPPTIDRLLGRSVEIDGCWVYQGPTDAKGYARVRHEGRKVFGHRYVWTFFFGEWPEGMTFDHLCKNTSCLNPWHGDIVPVAVNSARNSNAAKTHCPQGHEYDGANLKTGNYKGRYCRTCSQEANRAYRARKKAAA